MNPSLKYFVVNSAMTCILATAGTGGMYTLDSLQNTSQWYDNSASVSSNISSNNQILSPAECIGAIRDILQLNMSDLAALLHISRPTAYGWLNGNEPNAEAQKYIKYLVFITEKVRSLKIARMDLLIHRPIFEGRSLLDQLIAREDVSDSLQVLKNISDKEFANRQKIKGSGKNKASLADASHYHSTPVYRS